MQEPLSHGVPLWDSNPSESATSQDARRHDHGPQLRVSNKACPPETGFQDHQSRGPADAPWCKPLAVAVSSGCEEQPPLLVRWPPAAPQGHRPADAAWGPRDASVPREASLVRETLQPVDRSCEEEEDLPSLAFLWASPRRLLPCTLSLSPVAASGLACPGGRGSRAAAQSQSLRRRGHSQASPAACHSRKCTLEGNPAHAVKTTCPGADLRVCGRPALGLVPSSQPHKRKCDPSDPGRWKKRHCSQYGAEGCVPPLAAP